MKYHLLLVTGMALEMDQNSYESFEREKNDEKFLFHNFRDKSGVVHTIAKGSILSVAMESGLAVKML